jgi:type IV secretory pathway VirB10-like protein
VRAYIGRRAYTLLNKNYLFMLTILIVGLAVVVAAIWILSKTKKQTPEAPKATEVVSETPVVKLKPVLKKKAPVEAPAKAPKAAKAKPAKPAVTKKAGKKL